MMIDKLAKKETATEHLLQKGKEQGFVTTDDILEAFPEAEGNLGELEEAYARLLGENVDIHDSPEERPEKGRETGVAGTRVAEEEIDLDGIESDDIMDLYLGEVGNIPLLTAEEEVELAGWMKKGQEARRRLAEKKDLTAEEERRLQWEVKEGKIAQERLVNANSRLVVSIAKHYIGRGVPFPDLVQEGNLGLITAVKKFDPTRGYKLSTYATWWIRQAITRAVASQGRNIRLPVHMVENINKLNRASRYLEQKLGRQPTYEELAQELDMPPYKVERLIKLSRQPISLETPVGEGEDSSLGEFVEDKSSFPPSDLALNAALREAIEEALTTLTPREARILRLRFGLHDGHSYTLQEVGEKFGLTRERIRQIEGEALQRLRHPSRSRRFKGFES